MAESTGYNPLLLFDMLAQDGEFITISQIRNYLQERAPVSQRQLYQIFQRFDWERQGNISKRDFLREITPYNWKDGQLNLRGGSLTAEVEGEFIALILEILKRFRILQVNRKEVLLIPPYDAFAHLDPMKSGILGLNQLKKFLLQNDFHVSDQQLRLLLHGLRRRTYVEVNLEVFCENIIPLEFGQYQEYGKSIDRDRERELLSRSRNQEEIIRRSRVESQKTKHQIHKTERRRQAEIERQVELQSRVNDQILNHQQHRERLLRKAVLEEQRRLRMGLQSQSYAIQEQHLRSIAQAQRNSELAMLHSRERQINDNLARSALLRQRQIQDSRRIWNYERQLALRQEIQRDREARRLASRAQDLQVSRRALLDESARQMEAYQRRIQLQRIKQMEVDKQSTAKQSRMQEIQKELENTRFQMKERRSRLEQEDRSRRQQMTDNRGAGTPGGITRSYYV